MNEIISSKNIENMIYEIRGVQVMLSSDVAKLYHVKTRVLNQTIKRNIDRFPSTFCFQLTSEEIDELSLRSQFVILNKKDDMRGQHLKYAPYVLTEQGIMMLSGLLKSDVAVKVNIEIIDAFVKMRRYFANDNNSILVNHENRLLKLEEAFNKENDKLNKILFKGQIYDAYSVLLDIFNLSKEEIIIIDNYLGKELLDTLKEINKKIIIVSSNINEALKAKYQKQYNNITFINNNSYHDRFIIIDRIKLFHCGASFKDLGKKCFGISEMDNKKALEIIIQDIIE